MKSTSNTFFLLIIFTTASFFSFEYEKEKELIFGNLLQSITAGNSPFLFSGLAIVDLIRKTMLEDSQKKYTTVRLAGQISDIELFGFYIYTTGCNDHVYLKCKSVKQHIDTLYSYSKDWVNRQTTPIAIECNQYLRKKYTVSS